ncbi:hypothetical protein [Xanthobacter autotrophicus]|uniref:hypothetical protein n=1 Tax=Xanthobacter autotrophicus TaxID=280 RepID=UPI00372BD812
MQVVFVHGVNTRDNGDSLYQQAVATRDDRLKRLAFGADAKIYSPYWGQFGLPGKALASFPAAKGMVQALGNPKSPPLAENLLALARRDFIELISALSVAAITAAGLSSDEERHSVEDYWMAAVVYAEARGTPGWLANITTEAELAGKLSAEVGMVSKSRSLGTGWLPGLPQFDFHAVAAAEARRVAAGFLAQFLGDALMFFSRRDLSIAVRREIAKHIIVAATAAAVDSGPLVLIGHSMGGAVLQEVLSDPDEVAAIEKQLGRQLVVDLFLSVGTQIGLFAELNMFPTSSGRPSLAVPVKNYWNAYDYTDTLAYLCGPLIKGAVDFEVNTAAGVIESHVAYFQNALFFSRLKTRLKAAGIVS